jgi:hypothetical protein
VTPTKYDDRASDILCARCPHGGEPVHRGQCQMCLVEIVTGLLDLADSRLRECDDAKKAFRSAWTRAERLAAGMREVERETYCEDGMSFRRVHNIALLALGETDAPTADKPFAGELIFVDEEGRNIPVKRVRNGRDSGGVYTEIEFEDGTREKVHRSALRGGDSDGR